ncbi:Chondroitin sulfate synthase 3 [Chelonia mydas]|uniref:Hexosyltransferase n=1 Tax=Chelonia mydas TaxID=8469 RepID=M7BS69_CHEMY|nr:Chondroitin sulfate synthase 3 [Chelonia mydas]
MQQLFHENYEHNRKGYIQDLHNSKIHTAITLHPNKRPAYQYRLHNYILSRKISELRYRTIQLHRESALMSKLSNSEINKEDQQLGMMPSFNRFQPRERNEVIEWEFLTGKLLYSVAENQPPRQSINSILRAALDDTVMQVMEMINENSKSRGRLIDFKEIQYGYRRVDPMHGVEYILDLLLLYKRHKGRKLTVPVRRHAYLQQLFSKPFFKEAEELDVRSFVENINSDIQSFSFLSNSLKIFSSFQDTKEIGGHSDKKIHILVPLTGRYDIFLRFMENFEKTCVIPRQNVKLAVILFSSDSGQDSSKHRELIKEYHNKYPKADMTLIPMTGEFSRGLGLEMASSQFDNDTLLLFCDVDLIFTPDFLQRCRDNTIQGQQVYYPIIFSQYDPKVIYGGSPPGDSNFVFTKKTGFWRDYGFGITCIYKSDLLSAGGFDTSIQGWGLEDVDLFTKVIASGLTAFRSQEVGVVHVFHPVQCDPNLDPKQYKMCLGSKASTFASTMQLAELWLEKHLGVRLVYDVEVKTKKKIQSKTQRNLKKIQTSSGSKNKFIMLHFDALSKQMLGVQDPKGLQFGSTAVSTVAIKTVPAPVELVTGLRADEAAAKEEVVTASVLGPSPSTGLRARLGKSVCEVVLLWYVCIGIRMYDCSVCRRLRASISLASTSNNSIEVAVAQV